MKKRARLDSSIVGDIILLKVNGHILKKHVPNIDGQRQRIIPTVYNGEVSNLDEEEIIAIIEALDNAQEDEEEV